MVRVCLLVLAGLIGLWFFEQYSGRELGVKATLRGISDTVSGIAGLSVSGASASGYGMATSVGQSASHSAGSLASGVSSSMKAFFDN